MRDEVLSGRERVGRALLPEDPRYIGLWLGALVFLLRRGPAQA